jgi:hypothetical protein
MGSAECFLVHISIIQLKLISSLLGLSYLS